jgi:hypothetical protein
LKDINLFKRLIRPKLKKSWIRKINMMPLAILPFGNPIIGPGKKQMKIKN